MILCWKLISIAKWCFQFASTRTHSHAVSKWRQNLCEKAAASLKLLHLKRNLCAAGLRLLSKDFSQVWASHHRRKLMSGNFFPFAAEVFGRAPRTVTVWASSLYFHEYHYDKLPFVITLGRISSSEHAPHRQHSTTWNSFPITIITEKSFSPFFNPEEPPKVERKIITRNGFRSAPSRLPSYMESLRMMISNWGALLFSRQLLEGEARRGKMP